MSMVPYEQRFGYLKPLLVLRAEPFIDEGPRRSNELLGNEVAR